LKAPANVAAGLAEAGSASRPAGRDDGKADREGRRPHAGRQPKNVGPDIPRQDGQSRDSLFICYISKDIEVFSILGRAAATAGRSDLRLVNLNKSNYK
jgi:hypothetical protein